MAESEPLTVSFVSGKGGVGKTMLAVAFAHEISRNARTLLLDLDFFNRGLTGLMRHGTNAQQVAPPDFLEATTPAQLANDSWELIQVAPNVFHLRYPDLLPDQIRGLEDTNVGDLAESLARYLDHLRKVSNCDVIVMDCHGGPDQVSFAACLASDYSLLISEPDKITFYGTLHFVRQLERATPAAARKPDLRLVFNKVLPAFSVPYLEKLYDAEIRQYFGDHPLLAVFPLEIYLTKEFERTTFLTAVYPFSQLAKKTQVLIYDLLIDKSPRLAAASTPSRSRWPLWVTRHSLGRIPRIIDLHFVMAVIAGGFVLLTAIYFYGLTVAPKYKGLDGAVSQIETYDSFRAHPEAVKQPCDVSQFYNLPSCLPSEMLNLVTDRSALFASNGLLARTDLTYSPYPEVRDAYSKLKPVPWYDQIMLSIYYYLSGNGLTYSAKWPLLAGVALDLFLIALFLNWGILLDRAFTYNSRIHGWSVAISVSLVALALWSFPAAHIGTFVQQLHPYPYMFQAAFLFGHAEPGLVLLPASVIVVTVAVISQLSKAYRNVRFEKMKAEGAVRLIFLIALSWLAWLMRTPFLWPS